METKSNLTFLDKAAKIVFAFYVFTIFVFSSDADTNTISRLALIAFCGVACLMFFNTYKMKLDPYFWYIGVFVVFTFLSILWAIEPSLAVVKGITLVQILLMSVFAYSFFYAIDDTEFITKAIFVSGLCMCVYLLYLNGIGAYIGGLLGGMRMGEEFGNVNSVGSYAAITVIIGLYYAMFKNKKIYYLLILLPIFIGLGTGSRKVLLTFFVGTFVLFACKFRSEFTFKNIFKTVLIILVVVIVFIQILQLEMFATINERFQTLINFFTGQGVVDSSTLKRHAMIEGGMEQFFKTPVLGIGIGNSPVITSNILGESTYLHNNYVEILACGGIVGFICFYAMFAYVLINLIKLLLKNNSNAILPFTIIIIYLINQYAMVVYYDKTTYLYLVYCFLVIKKEKEKQNEQIKEIS